MITIYALHDVDLPGVYVGKTELEPEHRLRIHVAKALRHPRSRKDLWIKSVVAAGRRPQLVVLEEDPTDWQASETRWIAEMRFFLGDRCFNIRSGGEGRGLGTGHENAVPDMTGQVFGKLTVVERVESRRGARWLCACECGRETIVYGSNLRNGRTKSCGCVRGHGVGPRGKEVVAGTRVGRLVAERETLDARPGRWWECRCDCGRHHVVSGANLRAERVRSCGRCPRL
jgi:hypothetical protein